MWGRWKGATFQDRRGRLRRRETRTGYSENIVRSHWTLYFCRQSVVVLAVLARRMTLSLPRRHSRLQQLDRRVRLVEGAACAM